MKILLVSLVTIGAVAVFVGYVVVRQKRNDARFVAWLRQRNDTIVVKNVHFARARIQTDNHHLTQRKCGELLVGPAFVILPVVTPAALYNTASGRRGVRGITWSAAIDQAKVLDENSLQIDCRLPDDGKGFSRITFEGVLSDSNRNEILRRVGL